MSNTYNQHKAAGQGRKTGRGKARKRDRISLFTVIHSLHNFSMFSSGEAVKSDTVKIGQNI